MVKYILKRILLFIPALFFISFFAFFLKSLTTDSSELTSDDETTNTSGYVSKSEAEKDAELLRSLPGSDKPLFYFSVTNLSVPDGLYKISQSRHREALERLSAVTGHPEQVMEYYRSLSRMSVISDSLISSNPSIGLLKNILNESEALKSVYDLHLVSEKIKALEKNAHDLNAFPVLASGISACKLQVEKLNTGISYIRFIPVIRFYGFDNQYHHWITKFISGDFGFSFQDHRPVRSIVADALGWTVLLSFSAILFSYLISIPLGMYSASRVGKNGDRIISFILFLFNSFPNFWIATMTVIFFCGGDYLDIFPSFGASSLPADEPFINKLLDTSWHLMLPLICWTYGSLAYITRHVRGGLLNVLKEDFIRTARAKGLSEKTVITKHAFRNSLIPLITLFAGVFPMLLSGSFVIEYIFSIPGMGKISYQALRSHDYPVIFTLLIFSSLLTMTGMLVSDILYALADPRISFSSNRPVNE